MTFQKLPLLFALAMLACPALSSAQSRCPKPEYPPAALRQMEEGVSVLGIQIRSDGGVGQVVVLASSGHEALDKAAEANFSRCTFVPGTVDGKPAAVWAQVKFVWSIGDASDLREAKRAAGAATLEGDLAARYQLSLLLAATAKTPQEQDRAALVLRSAADLGQVHAQFDLGRRYEEGKGVPKDLEKAMEWYRKAAAQGDVIAIQRLETGLLP